MKLPFKIDLSGKLAVVTGGSGVLCSEFCRALAACGASVAVVGGSHLDRAQAVCDDIIKDGGKAIAFGTNVLDKAALETLRSEIYKKFGVGAIDILINGAGGNNPRGTTTKEYLEPDDIEASTAEGIKTFFDLDAEGIQYVLDLNFLGALLPTQVFARDMAKHPGSVIINVSSMNAFRPLTKIPAYSGAKAALSNLTQWLAVHFSKVGIRVNAIAPGFFVTEQNRAMLMNADGSLTPRSAKILAHTPMNRFGETSDLLGTLLWLADDASSGFVNGVVVPVDGGFAAYSGV